MKSYIITIVIDSGYHMYTVRGSDNLSRVELEAKAKAAELGITKGILIDMQEFGHPKSYPVNRRLNFTSSHN